MKRLRLRFQPPPIGPGTLASEPLPPPTVPPTDREQALERELSVARGRLEQLENLNAEYQAISEDLQTANEALLVSREELQSVNQELQAINGELAERLAELACVHNQAANLLASTGIATLFLDNGACVRSFTPRAAELFALLETDLARPVTALGARLPYAELEQDVSGVLDKGPGTRRRIVTAAGPDCIVRILPHHSIDGYLAGAVLTFLEIA